MGGGGVVWDGMGWDVMGWDGMGLGLGGVHACVRVWVREVELLYG